MLNIAIGCFSSRHTISQRDQIAIQIKNLSSQNSETRKPQKQKKIEAPHLQRKPHLLSNLFTKKNKFEMLYYGGRLKLYGVWICQSVGLSDVVYRRLWAYHREYYGQTTVTIKYRPQAYFMIRQSRRYF